MKIGSGGGKDFAVALRVKGVALPVADDTACLLDDENKRHEVVCFHVSFDDEVDSAGSKHGIKIGVAAIA